MLLSLFNGCHFTPLDIFKMNPFKQYYISEQYNSKAFINLIQC